MASEQNEAESEGAGAGADQGEDHHGGADVSGLLRE